MKFWTQRTWRATLRERNAVLGSEGTPRWQHVLPDPDRFLSDAPLLALDLEMTGLDAERDRIVSIGWAPIDAGRLRPGGGEHVLVRAAEEERNHAGVGQSATIHGIRDCDRRPGEELARALERLFEALDGRIPLVHHADLDHAFIDRACRRSWGHGWSTPILDTLHWERQRRRQRGEESAPGSLNLDALRRQYGLPQRSAHNALADAVSCGELALAMIARSPGRLIDLCRILR
jgi:DNA polymerase-3 subunit epsilon